MKRNGFTVMARLVKLVKPLTGFMILAILMGVVGNLFATFITVLGGVAIGDFMGFSSPIAINTIFILIVIFAILRGILRYGEQGCNHFIAFKLLALIRDKVFGALRKLAPAKLEGKDKGDLISVITSDIELLEVFYAHTISPIVIATVFSVIMTVFIGSYNIALGVIAALAYITIGALVPITISRLNGNKGLMFRKKSGELSAYILDSLRGLDETIQYNDGKNRLNNIKEKSEELAKYDESIKSKAGLGTAGVGLIIIFFDLLMLFVSSNLYMNGKIGLDGVIISTVAIMSSFGPVISLANLGSTLQYTFAAGNRVLDILEELPVTNDVAGNRDVDFDGIEVKDITFAYKDEQILSDISLSIPKGKIVGIIGKSGSGKSTLLKLLMRFWETQKGEILVSGTNINSVNTKNLRSMEGFVTQQTHLFNDTIFNNIKIAKLDATKEEVIDACKKASVHDFIMSLPNGYESNVGELGDSLSGGERQRIGLARAFLHNASLLLLDEPTSNLDSLNEAVILKSLYESHGDKTVVLVSHKSSTMNIADLCYSVENGRMS